MEDSRTAENPDLIALVREILPARWRHDVRVERSSGCLFIRFRDDEGHNHAFDIRVPQSDVVATVEGARLAYSYIEVDPEVDALDLLDAYREALQTLAAHEAVLSPFVLEPAPPRPDCTPAPPALRDALFQALPEAWRNNVVAFSTLDGFEIHFTDESGVSLALDGRYADPAIDAMVRGERLAFAYVIRDPRADTFAWYERYREALQRFVANEAAIAAALDSTRQRPAAPAVPDAKVDPTPDVPALQPAPEALAALLTEMLPAAWRHDLRAYLTEEGFLVRFRDADGRALRLDGRYLVGNTAALVRGQRLGFSHEGGAAEVTPPALVSAYVEVLRTFVAREQEILAHLPPPPAAEASAPRWRQRPDPRAITQPLLDLLRSALPEAWRADATAFLKADETVTLRARDEQGVLHAIQCGDVSRSAAPMVKGALTAFWYDRLDPRLDEEAALPVYREIMDRLVAQESEIVRSIDALGAR
ncbi:MAG: hypothetical protein U0325_14635 [Polyangiales bacterium]